MKKYVAIDLKSFYASVECVERGLDPLKTNLVVADASRTDKTICLAITPTLKARCVPSRPRLFEVKSAVASINASRRWYAPSCKFSGKTYDDTLLKENSSLELDYITATPRMALYIEYSSKIYGIYLKYFSPEDIHVYSIDEVFIDVSGYLRTYKKTAEELTRKVILDVYEKTGITATAGIGDNLYLAKVAMDIVAKRMSPDKNGVRIAELSEMSYRNLLWDHRPLTDFWRVGRGYMKRLESHGIYTMGDIALVSVACEDILYKMLGVNAELLIDHAWGYEPCTIESIKAYKPLSESISIGQVLDHPYSNEKGAIILREMCDSLVLDMVEKGIAAKQVVLHIGYEDPHGYAHGSENFVSYTSSGKEFTEALLRLYNRITDASVRIKRINITAVNLKNEDELASTKEAFQIDFFSDNFEFQSDKKSDEQEYKREKSKQKAVVSIKNKYGKNAILTGKNFIEGATGIKRNLEIGGHKA